ncbi:MAG: hypothetical protein NT133_25090 [Alphaproteobacteria bacterium]|nr:hypothetical protein [Alphaproteobacteria bacterium]
MSSSIQRALSRLRAAIADRRGVSAMEFAGGIYAMSYPTSLTGMQTAVTAALPTGWTDVTVSTPVASCSCWATGGTVTAADCTSDPICPIGQVNQRFIALSVTRPFEPLLLPTATFNSVSTTYVVRVQ